jgi:twinkle protein
MLTITEGEIDAMSYSQVQGNKWPVWSIGSGAGPQVRKYIADRRDLFLQFERSWSCSTTMPKAKRLRV